MNKGWKWYWVCIWLAVIALGVRNCKEEQRVRLAAYIDADSLAPLYDPDEILEPLYFDGDPNEVLLCQDDWRLTLSSTMPITIVSGEMDMSNWGKTTGPLIDRLDRLEETINAMGEAQLRSGRKISETHAVICAPQPELMITDGKADGFREDCFACVDPNYNLHFHYVYPDSWKDKQ